jgi:putative ABC transport system permease protein
MFQIVAVLRRHRTASLLIICEIALTCAIVCNALFLLSVRLARMDQPSGAAEAELVRVFITTIGEHTFPQAITKQDLTGLRSIPGVKNATSMDVVPFEGTHWIGGVSPQPTDDATSISGAMYMGRSLVDVLGLHLVAGRDFLPEEYIDGDDAELQTKQVIVTRAVAAHFFPDGAVGKPLYIGGSPRVIVGVIDHIAVVGAGFDLAPDDPKYAFLLPGDVAFSSGGSYVLRVDPGQINGVFGAVDGVLAGVDPNRLILDRKTFADIRRDHFQADRSMAYLLAITAVALLGISALGMIGLASFWVQQRTHQIGVRRALGATRGDILRYFQLENFILATAGIVLGMMLAYATNQWLMHAYQVPRMPGSVLPIVAVLLWTLGQIAVLVPALRASLIPPAAATRMT